MDRRVTWMVFFLGLLLILVGALYFLLYPYDGRCKRAALTVPYNDHVFSVSCSCRSKQASPILIISSCDSSVFLAACISSFSIMSRSHVSFETVISILTIVSPALLISLPLILLLKHLFKPFDRLVWVSDSK